MYVLKHIAITHTHTCMYPPHCQHHMQCTHSLLVMYVLKHTHIPITPHPHTHIPITPHAHRHTHVCTHHIGSTTCNAHTIFSFINTRSYTLPPGRIHYLPLDYCSNWCHAHTPQMQREKEGVGRGRSFSLCSLSKITNTHTNECSYVPVCTQYLQCLAMLSNAILHVALHTTHNYQLSIHI